MSSEDLASFRAWFAEFDGDAWARQFETDVTVGKLDILAEKALEHLRQGRCTDLWDIKRLQTFGVTINCLKIFKNWLPIADR